MAREQRLAKGGPNRGLRSDPQHPWRYDNMGRLLLSSLVNWQDILVAGLQERGFRRFRTSHMSLLRHIDLGGTRITEIAQRSRVSKQTIGQALVACEAEKLVKTIPDPTDRRAKIVTFTNLGRAVIVAERDIMEHLDAELAAVLGPEVFDELRKSLAELAEWPGPYAGRKKKRAPTARTSPRSAPNKRG
jgi:DNA-binding MarR family transcriptional regulator